MKKLLLTIAAMSCILSLTAVAADKKELTPDQQKEKKALIDKYDTNKDGKLDKEERAKMSKEDKQKYSDLTGGGHKKDEKKDK